MKAKIFIMIASVMSFTLIHAQITETSNTPQTSNPEYVGWNGQGSFSKPLDIKNQFSGEDIILWTTDGTSTAERVTILSGGNVGIGVTAPAYTLEVNGTIAAKQMLITTDDKTQDLLALIVELQTKCMH